MWEFRTQGPALGVWSLSQWTTQKSLKLITSQLREINVELWVHLMPSFPHGRTPTMVGIQSLDSLSTGGKKAGALESIVSASIYVL